MRVLLLGGGGREHAIGWKLARSPRVTELVSLPGNPGLADLGPTVEGISPDDPGAVSAMARVHGVDLVVVGPEAPLAAGVADALLRLGVPVFGPTRDAARLESSKSFAKEVMDRAGVPTAGSLTVSEPNEGIRHLDQSDGPYVVKADGLAAGKGVLVTESRAEAKGWLNQWIESGPVVIEDFLDGPEVSVFAICTESGAKALQPARDYKRLGDGDVGPNTGGMGSYSPVPDLPSDLVDFTLNSVVEPTLRQMESDGNPFGGFLYVGLVLTSDGPRVLEFNVRLGDPETQAIMPLLESDLIDVLEGADPVWSARSSVNVVLASKGYPTAPERGAVIKGLGSIDDSDVVVFHAGTTQENGRLQVSGGRVLSVVGLGDDLDAARAKAYGAVDAVSWPGKTFRRDIALERT